MRNRLLGILLLGGLACAGCGPALEPEELGQVVFGATPEVPLTKQSYVLKEVPPPPPNAGMPGMPPMPQQRLPGSRERQ